MTKFKFRAWDNKGKCMLDWLCICQTAFNRVDENGYGLMYRILTNQTDAGDDFGFVVMPDTGLKDKNGKEIYDGDILSSPSLSIPSYEVFYDRGCFRLRYKLKSGEYYDWGPLYRMEEIRMEGYPRFNPEVIGNIYENPELLTPTTK